MCILLSIYNSVAFILVLCCFITLVFLPINLPTRSRGNFSRSPPRRRARDTSPPRLVTVVPFRLSLSFLCSCVILIRQKRQGRKRSERPGRERERVRERERERVYKARERRARRNQRKEERGETTRGVTGEPRTEEAFIPSRDTCFFGGFFE